MHLTHLSLTDYRAFTRLDMDVPRRVLVLVGGNAQGKTSVLEAIYYLATFNSFHTHTDRQLINFMACDRSPAVARIVAGFQKGSQAHRLEVRLIMENGGSGGGRFRREILCDGVKRSATEALGTFNAVIFLPQMTRIIDGEPEERRRYLNLALAQAVPGYAQALSEYDKALAQRNALLRQLAEHGGDAGQLRTWDELLAERGALIIQARIAAVQEIERLAARLHHRLTHAQEVLRVVYQPAYDPLAPVGQYALPIQTGLQRGGYSREQIRQGFLQRLEALRGDEISRGVTTCGPHRDELRFMSNGVDLGDYGSRGQVRTTLMALKLAEMGWLKERTGQWPVLLLDEILAELDLQRRADLLETLSECEQAILTTTDLGQFAGPFVEQTTIWRVNEGRVENK